MIYTPKEKETISEYLQEQIVTLDKFSKVDDMAIMANKIMRNGYTNDDVNAFMTFKETLTTEIRDYFKLLLKQLQE